MFYDKLPLSWSSIVAISFSKTTEKKQASILPVVAIFTFGVLLMLTHTVKDMGNYLQTAFIRVEHPIAYKPLLYDALLKKYVQNYRVDYTQLKASHDIDKVVDELARTSPDKLPDDKSKLVFWANAYNALTLKSIVDVYPVKTVRRLERSYSQRTFIVGGQLYSLQDIYVNIYYPIVERVDVKALFLTCGGSLGDPGLINHALSTDQLQEDMDGSVKRFVNDPANVFYDSDHKRLAISQFFELNSVIFDRHYGSAYEFVNENLPPNKQYDMQTDVGMLKVFMRNFNHYLNDSALKFK